MASYTLYIAIATSYYFQLPLMLLAIFLAYQLLRKAINEPVVLKVGKNQRRLGNFEEWLQILSDQRDGSSNICVVLSVLSETKLPKDFVREALVNIAQRQPMLRAVVKSQCPNSLGAGKNRFFVFEIIDSKDVAAMMDFSCYDDVSASRWREICADMIRLRTVLGMELSQLLWKAVLLKEEYLTESGHFVNTFMFRFRHNIIDGVSCMKFCEQFLSCLNNRAPQGTNEIESLNLYPSLYEYFKSMQPFSIWKFLSAFYPTKAILKLLFMRNQRHLLANQADKPNSFFTEKPSAFPLKENFVCKVFSESETSHIIKACKENKATVTGTLEAIAHMVYCRLLQEDSSFVMKENFELVSGFAINARRYCKPSPHEDYLGNFPVNHSRSIPYRVESAEFWSLARESTKYIRELVKQASFIPKLLYVNDLFSPQEIVDNEFMMPEATDEEVLATAKKANCNLVSSKGPFNFANEETSTYKLHECLTLALTRCFPTTFVHFITTTNGKMAWVILSHPRATLEFTQKFAERCFDFAQNMTDL